MLCMLHRHVGLSRSLYVNKIYSFIHTRLTHAAAKIIFKTPTRCSDKYLNSPLYKGTKIWNTLDVNIQQLDTIDRFVKYTKQPYLVYQNCFIE